MQEKKYLALRVQFELTKSFSDDSECREKFKKYAQLTKQPHGLFS